MEIKPKSPLIFSFEGIDASGKNTQSRRLVEWLRSRNILTELTSFPDYSTPIGMEIRAFLSGTRSYPVEARHMLFAINRLEHKEEIESWKKQGKIVVINRYCQSGIAYGAASGLSLDWLKSLESQMPQADYIFYLKASSGLSSRRKKERDKFEADLRYLDRVTSVYDAFAESQNWFTIEADNEIETIQYEVRKIVSDLLRLEDNA